MRAYRTRNLVLSTGLTVFAVACVPQYVSMGDDTATPNENVKDLTPDLTPGSDSAPFGSAPSAVGGARAIAPRTATSGGGTAPLGLLIELSTTPDSSQISMGGAGATTRTASASRGGSASTNGGADFGGNAAGGARFATSEVVPPIAMSCSISEGILSGATRGQTCGEALRCTYGTTARAESCASEARDICWCGDQGRVICGHGLCLPSAWRTLVGPEDVPQFTAIRVGGTHAIGLQSGTVARSWGAGASGQIGDGHYFDRPWATMTVYEGLQGIAAGDEFSCGLRADGGVVCWGRYYLGADNVVNTSTPRIVEGPRNIVEISASGKLACARSAAGAITCWGLDGQHAVSPSTPVATLPNTTMLTAGCALQRNGTVQCWGENGLGQNGDGTTEYRTAPVTVLGVANAISISGKGMALLASGTVAVWGGSTKPEQNSARVIADLTGVAAVSKGNDHNCVLMEGGTVRCWGSNTFGQLGDGTYTSHTYPLPVVGLANVTAIASGNNSSCALVTGGIAYCWGNNEAGKLGNGSTRKVELESVFAMDSAIPVKVTNAPIQPAT